MREKAQKPKNANFKAEISAARRTSQMQAQVRRTVNNENIPVLNWRWLGQH